MISSAAAGLAVLPESGFVSPSGRSARGSHQLAAIKVCERLWWLRYEKGYVLREEKEHRLHGTLIHLCMAYHYASKLAQPPAWFFQQDLDSALYEKAAGHIALVEKSKHFLLAYREQYANDPLIPTNIEEEFSATVAELDPVLSSDAAAASDVAPGGVGAERVTCRPDLVARVEQPGGAGPGLYIVDYKTQGKGWGRNEGLETWNPEGEWSLNWQILVNLQILRAPSNAARLGGLPILGFIIQRGTRKPDSRGAFHLDRNIVSVSPWAYEQAGSLIRSCVAHEVDLKARTRLGEKPNASLGWACTGRYGNCDYHAVCRARSREAGADVLRDQFNVEAR